LAGPVELELAKAVEQLPGRNGLPGGSRYELKYDGYRCAVVRRNGTVRLWSRNGTDLTDKFPDVHKALDAQLQRDCVLDGELIVWNGERLDFGALQQRMITSAATIRRQLAPKWPASYVAFDLLAIDKIDIRMMRLSDRQRRLTSLATGWRPPLQLSPVTDDPDEACEWLDAFSYSGVEGLVVKGAGTRYQPGRRDWVKVKNRDTIEVIVGAVTGSIDHPEVVVCGRYRGRDLEIVGRTVPLDPAQANELAAVLKPAGDRHPWPDEISAGYWGRGAKKVPIVKVRPLIVAEVAADAARQGDHYRHPLRFHRVRGDLTPNDVDRLPV
jgi:ATP-dependent DNA ligase